MKKHADGDEQTGVDLKSLENTSYEDRAIRLNHQLKLGSLILSFTKDFIHLK